MIATLEATATELITEFLDEIRLQLLDDLSTKNRNATGRTSASIQLANISKSTGQLVANDNVLFTFQGRAPGNMPPVSALIDWCNARGLPRGVAWAVAKRIAEAGTELFRKGAASDNALQRALSAENIKEFSDAVKTSYTGVIKSDLRTLINK